MLSQTAALPRHQEEEETDKINFILVFFSPFSIAITSLGEESANLSAFRTFVRFALVWFCLFPLPLGVWKRLHRLGRRGLVLVLFVRLFGLCLFGFVGFLFLLVSGKGCVFDCGTPWTFLLPFFL